MNATALPPLEASPAKRALSTLITEQLRLVLEQRTVRWGVVGMLLVAASAFTLVPTPVAADSEWMFILPVAISAASAGLREGLLVALISALLVALFASAETARFDPDLVMSVVTARFALYGITAAVLGAFAEAHYAVQTSLRQLASTDPLTKVSNVERFYHELQLLDAMGARYVVLLTDMDGLKEINDTYGHQTGSNAIQVVANVLRRVVRATDVVARFGGDEFVVILKETDRVGSQIVVNRVRKMLVDERLADAPDIRLSVSIGTALSGEDGTTSQELLEAADRAMYEDKRLNKAGRDKEPTAAT